MARNFQLGRRVALVLVAAGWAPFAAACSGESGSAAASPDPDAGTGLFPSNPDPTGEDNGGGGSGGGDDGGGVWEPDAVPGSAGLAEAPGAGAEGYEKKGTLTIPTAHPRLWWNAERIAQGKKWVSSSANAKALSDAVAESDAHPFDLGTHYILTGNKASCTKAISRAMAYTIPGDQLDTAPCDTCRWEPWPYVVYDWCYAELTATQKSTLLSRFTGYVERVIKNSQREEASGNMQAPANNYFWGYLRNEIDWGIASMHESSKAQTLLDYGLKRYETSFVPFAVDGGARGGVPLEGSHYGPYMHEYALLPFVSAKNLGRNMFRETPYFREAALFWIHATLPKATATRTGKSTYNQYFTFGDHSENDGYAPVANADVGNFMNVIADEFRDVPVGQYARRWVSTYKPPRSNMVLALDRGGAELPLEDLPLDYYAAGNGFAFSRTTWAPESTVVHLTLGRTTSFGGHDHTDVGSFQLWRSGRWLSKESALYASTLDWGSAMSTWAHNGLSLSHPTAWKGRPYAAAEGYPKGAPKVVRLQTEPTHFFAAVDMSDAYKATDTGYTVSENGVECFRDHNPYVQTAVREFVFVRPLEALIVLDRVATKASSQDAATRQKFPSYSWKAEDVQRVFNFHLGLSNPTITQADRMVEASVGGGQLIRVQTVLPTTVSIAVVDEMKRVASDVSSENRQWRVEMRATGAAEMHMLNVVQATSTGDGKLTSKTTEDATSITLDISHPTKGKARLVITKGMASSGGTLAVGLGTAGLGTPMELRADVQSYLVGDSGPAWGK